MSGLRLKPNVSSLGAFENIVSPAAVCFNDSTLQLTRELQRNFGKRKFSCGFFLEGLAGEWRVKIVGDSWGILSGWVEKIKVYETFDLLHKFSRLIPAFM
jgi:hypothetical protein